MSYDDTSPAQGHQALSDIDIIRSNTNELRKLEASLAASPPSNPVGGQFWWATDTTTLYQRNQANTTWVFIWSASDLPAKSSVLTNHINANITNAVTVHGIRQGSGNGLDADFLDGNHASAFAGASHTHGGGDITSQVSDADTVDGSHASSFATAGHSHSGLVTNGNLHNHNGGEGAQIPEGGLANNAVALAKLKLGGGSYSYTNNNTVDIMINRYSHWPRVRSVATAGDFTTFVDGARAIRFSVGDSGYLDTIRVVFTVGSYSSGTGYVWWDYHLS